MNEVVARLGQWWWKTRPAVLEELAPGLMDDAIAAYEQELGVSFSEGMRALYRWRDGALPDRPGPCIIGRYALMSLREVAANQKTMNELLDQGTFKTKNWWRRTWLPVFSKGTGDFLCWDPRGSFSGEKGQLLEFWHTDHDRTVLAPSFDGFLTAYVDSLEAGVWTYDDENGLDDGGMFEPFLAARFPGYPHRPIERDGKRPQKPTPPPPAVEAEPDRPVKMYAASAMFDVADRVEHPQFGTGVVQAVEQTKVVILFTSGRRTLVHGRGGGDRLEKPSRIAHAKPAPRKV
jgi:cell wall assembly regulator SMI1